MLQCMVFLVCLVDVTVMQYTFQRMYGDMDKRLSHSTC